MRALGLPVPAGDARQPVRDLRLLDVVHQEPFHRPAPLPTQFERVRDADHDRPFAADREHLHHILLRAGYTPGQTVAIVYALSLLLAAIGVAGWWLDVPEYVMFYAFMALFGLYLYSMLHAWKLMKKLRRIHDGWQPRNRAAQASHD